MRWFDFTLTGYLTYLNGYWLWCFASEGHPVWSFVFAALTVLMAREFIRNAWFLRKGATKK